MGGKSAGGSPRRIACQAETTAASILSAPASGSQEGRSILLDRSDQSGRRSPAAGTVLVIRFHVIGLPPLVAGEAVSHPAFFLEIAGLEILRLLQVDGLGFPLDGGLEIAGLGASGGQAASRQSGSFHCVSRQATVASATARLPSRIAGTGQVARTQASSRCPYGSSGNMRTISWKLPATLSYWCALSQTPPRHRYANECLGLIASAD